MWRSKGGVTLAMGGVTLLILANEMQEKWKIEQLSLKWVWKVSTRFEPFLALFAKFEMKDQRKFVWRHLEEDLDQISLNIV